MIINRTDTIIFVNCLEPKIMLALKFKIVDGKLYAYNFFLPEESRNLIEVKKVNGVDVSNFINEIDENYLHDIDKMKKYNIDTSTDFVLDVLIENNIEKYDVFSSASNANIFFKNHEINKFINEEEIVLPDEKEGTNNLMLEYASTSVKVLLRILIENCISEHDKKSIDNLLLMADKTNENYSNVRNNIDMQFFSTLLLMINEEGMDYISENVRHLLDSNLYIYNDEPVDLKTKYGDSYYKRIITIMRNSIAHSNYVVLENGKIEFQIETKKNKKNIQLCIGKNAIRMIFNELYYYNCLNGIFPYVEVGTEILNIRRSFDKEEFIDCLNKIKIYDVADYKVKLNSDLDDYRCHGLLREIARHGEIGLTWLDYSDKLKEYLDDDFEVNIRSLTFEDKKYIVNEIKKMDVNYFFGLGKTSQVMVINNLIKQKYNKKDALLKQLNSITSNSYDGNSSLTNFSYSYVELKLKIELLITTLFNNLFMFCYNQNESQVDAQKLRFPDFVYEDFFNSEVKQFYANSNEAADCEFVYDNLLKATFNHCFFAETMKNMESRIENTKKDLIKNKSAIEYVDKVISREATDEDYDIVNKLILNRFRNCLAHGRLIVDDIDVKDIVNTKITIVDIYEEKEMFRTTLELKDILASISQPEFFRSLLNENTNFLRHIV